MCNSLRCVYVDACGALWLGFGVCIYDSTADTQLASCTTAPAGSRANLPLPPFRAAQMKRVENGMLICVLSDKKHFIEAALLVRILQSAAALPQYDVLWQVP
jgi:hypothetical protein